VADLITLDYTGTNADGTPATIGEIVADVTEPDGFPVRSGAPRRSTRSSKACPPVSASAAGQT
jgi:hypothetical protein